MSYNKGVLYCKQIILCFKAYICIRIYLNIVALLSLVEERRLSYKKINIKRRMFILLCFFFFVFLYMVFRLFKWQVLEVDYIQKQKSSQNTRNTPLKAARGKILDKKGVVLSSSGPSYRVIAIPKEIVQKEETARELAEILDLEYEEVLKKVSRTDRDQIDLKRQIDDEVYDRLLTRSLVGIQLVPDTKRHYPLKNLAAQLVGYTNVDGNGQEGLELKYEKELAGIDGKTFVEIGGDRKTVPQGDSYSVAPEDGNDLILTIDSTIQSFVTNAAKECLEVNNANNVQVIVTRPKTGEVLAMATLPDFDLNNPPRNDNALRNSLSRNRVIADANEPGSTFKILTLASGLESGAVTPSSTFDCIGYKIVDGQKIKCWRTTPHGHETLAQGVENSCNPVFMEIALNMGTDNFYEYLKNFGLDSIPGINLASEAVGSIINKKEVKTYDLARIGFGQSISMTPLQLVTAVGAAINGGNLMRPYVIEKVVAPDGSMIEKNEPTVVKQVISPQTSQIVNEMLEGVVKNGSGRNAYLPGYKVGGKTGTAQKYENNRIAPGKYVASFIGFAPANDPEVLVLVLVDEPKISSQVFGSTVAAPYVRTILYQTLRHLQVLPEYDEDESEYIPVEMPDVRNMMPDEATAKLRSLGITPTLDGSGIIINQAPQPGAEVPSGSGVLLYTAIPVVDQQEAVDNKITVPSVVGKTLIDAYDILDQAGFKVETSTEPDGVVVAQEPAAGSKADIGSTVYVSF